MDKNNDVKNITVSIYVKHSSLIELMKVLKILQDLPIDHNYKFNTTNIHYSITPNLDWMQINIPKLLQYLKSIV